MNTTEKVEILLVEDNQHDAEMTMRALRKNNIIHHILHVKDGRQALDFLFGEGEFAGRDTTIHPQVILLDLKMPRIGGIEVLTKIKAEAATQHIIVIVLSSSSEDPNMQVCLNLGAANFIVKPVKLEGFIKALKDIHLHWPLVTAE